MCGSLVVFFSEHLVYVLCNAHFITPLSMPNGNDDDVRSPVCCTPGRKCEKRSMHHIKKKMRFQREGGSARPYRICAGCREDSPFSEMILLPMICTPYSDDTEWSPVPAVAREPEIAVR